MFMVLKKIIPFEYCTNRSSYEDLEKNQFFLHYGDMTDATNLIRLIQKLNLMKFITLPHKVMFW